MQLSDVGMLRFFFFQAEDGIRDYKVTGVQTCALPICQAGQQAAAREWVHGHGRTPFHEEDRAPAWYCSRSARLSTLPISLRGRLAASRSSATRWVFPTRAFSHSRSEERRVGKERRSRW